MRSVVFAVLGILCSTTSVLAAKTSVENQTGAPIRVLFVRQFGVHQKDEEGWYHVMGDTMYGLEGLIGSPVDSEEKPEWGWQPNELRTLDMPEEVCMNAQFKVVHYPDKEYITGNHQDFCWGSTKNPLPITLPGNATSTTEEEVPDPEDTAPLPFPIKPPSR